MANDGKILKLKELFGKFFKYTREGGLKSAFAQLGKYIIHAIQRRNALRELQLCAPLALVPGLDGGHPEAIAKAKALLRADLDVMVCVAGHYTCIYGAGTDFAGVPCAVVAHWDSQQVVDPYVEYLCRHFKSLGWKVVLASASLLRANEVLYRKDEWSDAIVCRNCSGYDFTSWKAALDCFPSLYESEFLVLTNDSYFGPIGSFASVHEQMKGVKCDFWGLTANYDIAPHLQSYYVVLKKAALRHEALKRFFEAVKMSSSREQAITYEVSLTLWLALHGLRAATFCGIREKSKSAINLSIYQWDSLIEKGCPILKREKFRPKIDTPLPTGWNNIVSNYGYPPMIIANYFWRMGEDISWAQTSGVRYKSFPPSVFELMQDVDLASAPTTMVAESLAVFLHVFYIDSFVELVDNLGYLPKRSHLYVSTDSEEKKRSITALLAPLGLQRIDVRVFPNKGWDIASFIVGWRDVIPMYSLVLKIHAKKSANHGKGYGAAWRNVVFSSLLGSKERVQRIVSFFDMNPALGLIAPVTYPEVRVVESGKSYLEMRRILRKKNIKLPRNAAIDFPVGSMFWARTAVLRHWLDLGLTFDDFESTATSPRDGTLAHALERLFVWGCGFENMTWGRVAPVGYEKLRSRIGS